MEKGRTTFTIYGSCVTRDVFNFLDNEIYYPQVTVEFNPIQTMYAKKFEIEKEYVDIDSPFTNRMVYYNFSKEAKDILSKVNTDYFIFDMSSERLPLQTWINGETSTTVPVTWNTYCLGNNLKTIEKYKKLKILNWHLPNADSDWKENIKKFCDIINEKFIPSNVILLQTEQVDTVIDKESLMFKSLTMNRNEFNVGIDKRTLREKQNRLIKQAEEEVLKNIPNCWLIKFPQNTLGNARHHFKEHPLHYDYLYYEYVAEAIKMIAKNREESDKVLVQKQLKFLLLRYIDKFERISQLIDKSDCIKVQFCGTSNLYIALKETRELFFLNPICDINMESILSEPYTINRNKCKSYLNENETLELLNDCNKIHKLQLQYSDAKWLVLDFRSEFLKSLRLKNSTVIMDKYVKPDAQIIEEVFEENNCSNLEELKIIIKNFCELILSKWKPENIIVIENYYNVYYFNKFLHIRKNKKAIDRNKYLRCIYENIYQFIGNCRIVKKPLNSITFF